MAGNTKALRLRIKSVSSTLQLTKAMGLVASSKIRRANLAAQKAREYKSALLNIVETLSSDTESLKSPYMRQNETGITRLVVIAGDRGMAGGYNANVFKMVRDIENAEILSIGKRAYDRFGGELLSSEKFDFSDAQKIAQKLCTEFLDGKFDRLGVVYTECHSAMSQEVKIAWLLPLKKLQDKQNTSVVFEPDCITVLNNAVKEYVAGMLVCLTRESFASEVNARRMAMDSAGKNAKQRIDDLTLEYNRARQGAITQEITEIVAGSGEM